MIRLPMQPRWLVSFVIAFGSTSAMAYDFSQADILFQDRDNGPTAIQSALEEYSQPSRSELSENELVYAAEQKSRLYMYWSYIVNQSNTAQRVDIANGCLNAIDVIKPIADFAETPQYYFWRAACLMARANAKGIAASLSESRLIAETIDAGIRVDPTYEGGGFDRLSGVLYSKLPFWNPTGGPSGDLPRALQHFERALNADVYDDPMFPDWKDPDTETGDYYYSTYFYYAEALKANSEVARAKEVASEALARINDEDFPIGREPEAFVAKSRLESFLRSAH